MVKYYRYYIRYFTLADPIVNGDQTTSGHSDDSILVTASSGHSDDFLYKGE